MATLSELLVLCEWHLPVALSLVNPAHYWTMMRRFDVSVLLAWRICWTSCPVTWPLWRLNTHERLLLCEHSCISRNIFQMRHWVCWPHCMNRPGLITFTLVTGFEVHSNVNVPWQQARQFSTINISCCHIKSCCTYLSLNWRSNATDPMMNNWKTPLRIDFLRYTRFLTSSTRHTTQGN